jgi:hypoxanthine phosphoribosyltransferase
MAEIIKVLVSEEEVNERIKTLGKQISENYAGKQIHMICVLKGGVFFMCELAKRITVPVSLDFMSVSSYGSDTKSSGVVKIVKDLDESLKDKEVIVVEDIVDSGRTLSYLLEMLKDRGADKKPFPPKKDGEKSDKKDDSKSDKKEDKKDSDKDGVPAKKDAGEKKDDKKSEDKKDK